MKDLLEHAPEIIKTASTSPLGILALMVLVVGVLGYLFFGQQATGERTRAVIFLAILSGVVAFGYAVERAIPTRSDGQLYRLRVTVVGPNDVPVDDARVWSSLGGEPKKVAGGWQFDIPAASVPSDGQATIYASKESAFLRGEAVVKVAEDTNPAATVRLVPTNAATVRGIVIDTAGKAIGDVQVTVIGHGNEGATTDSTGGFVLPAHAADGQQVELHAERSGYKPVNQWLAAGDEPVTLVLDKE